MKFAVLPKFALLAVLACAFAFTGCGFLNNSNSAKLTAGNWSFIATSTVTPGQVSHIGGNLTISGKNVSSTMHSDLNCFDVSAPFTFGGTLQNKQITFTSAANANSQVITVIASVTNATTITGTYTVTEGGGCASDQGTIAASLVPAINGTWSGPIVTGFGGSNVTLALALTQATTASSDGTYALTGNVTYANSTCSLSGTVNNSFLAGSMLVINGTTVETDSTAGSFTVTSAALNSSSAPTSFGGTYQVIDGLCAGDAEVTTFTKQ